MGNFNLHLVVPFGNVDLSLLLRNFPLFCCDSHPCFVEVLKRANEAGRSVAIVKPASRIGPSRRTLIWNLNLVIVLT